MSDTMVKILQVIYFSLHPGPISQVTLFPHCIDEKLKAQK